ncbi:RNA polymerase sigma factor [Gemmata palustris]|nr:RNA polymerase sigma factor [Gemmata palustris]
MWIRDSSPSLHLLFERLKVGDSEALNDIFAHCQERLKTHIRRMLRGFRAVRVHGSTNDVFQEAAMRLVKALKTVPIDSPTDFLLFAACQIRRTLLDMAKRKKLGHVPAVGGDRGDELGPADLVTDDSNDPVTLAIWQEVHARIGAMQVEDRTLFDLLYYQGLSQPAAAELLDVPLSTLKKRWQNARLELMLQFENLTPFS